MKLASGILMTEMARKLLGECQVNDLIGLCLVLLTSTKTDIAVGDLVKGIFEMKGEIVGRPADAMTEVLGVEEVVASAFLAATEDFVVATDLVVEEVFMVEEAGEDEVDVEGAFALNREIEPTII